MLLFRVSSCIRCSLALSLRSLQNHDFLALSLDLLLTSVNPRDDRVRRRLRIYAKQYLSEPLRNLIRVFDLALLLSHGTLVCRSFKKRSSFIVSSKFSLSIVTWYVDFELLDQICVALRAGPLSQLSSPPRGCSVSWKPRFTRATSHPATAASPVEEYQ